MIIYSLWGYPLRIHITLGISTETTGNLQGIYRASSKSCEFGIINKYINDFKYTGISTIAPLHG